MAPVRGVGFATALIISLLSSNLSLANPTGGEVVLGEGAITHTSDTRLDVIQTSDRLGIEWQDFSIGRGEQVNFDQPSRSAIALNRVTGSRISNIEGLLTANGNVFLVNRNGVIFHRSAVVDVGGLLATTVDLSNQDFLSGRFEFNRNVNPDGRVVNEGTISVAEGGLAALVAPSVHNAGVIEARLGRVALGSGNSFTLDLYGDELVSFAVADRVVRNLTAGEALVEHSGTIDVPGGRVWLTANAARGVVDGAINLSGVVRARTVSSRAGRIVLKGGGGSVRVAGTLDATGGLGQSGGDIEVLGASVDLASGATLDVSGGTGGGTVRVGGDLRGQGPRPRAARTTVAAGAAVRADALVDGDGGTLVVWSDERTVVDGALSARGGPAGGDGGLVETSSAGELEFSVPVQVGAPAGRAGTWLLDPEDIDIGRGEADSIEDTLNEGGHVSIETSDGGDGDGDIAVNASITKTEGDDASLSMKAHGTIDVNAPIRSEEGKLDVSLKAGKEVNVKAGVETNGGRFSSSVTGVKEPDAGEGEGADTGGDVAETEATAEADSDGGDADTPEADADSGDTERTEPEDPDQSGDEEMVTQLAGSDEVDSDTGEVADAEDPDLDAIESTEHVAATAAPPADTSPSSLPVIRVERTVATKGGEISVDAGETGVSFVTGNLDSSNLDEGQTGGDIEVLGEHVVVAGDAVVDASGDAGGGDIHIGGDYQGEGERHNAETTTIGKRVVIRSDATGDGDAGTVVVWADGTTRFQGTISARGGPGGGDGGQVEVSGKQNLGFWGTVDAGAPAGRPGNLLLDPEKLSIIDAERGEGELDLDVLCEGVSESCWMPAKRFLPPPGTTEDPADQYIFPEEFADLGIDPDPNTPLNTLSWGRLIQLSDVTGFGIRLEADQDITFAALDGTVSTWESPTGSEDGYGWTIRLALKDPGRLESKDTVRDHNLGLSALSHHGDIVFENPHDNLLVYGGIILFQAPEGKIHVGNLYAPGRADISPDEVDDSTWKYSGVDLRAWGDIETGIINTRIDPARLVDPHTGGPRTQNLLTGPAGFDLGGLDPALRSDPYQGGVVLIVSTGGNVSLLGQVYTGTGLFFAQAAGTFTATNIDTGANRFLVEKAGSPMAHLNTLNTGDVEITGTKIVFDQINAGRVRLNALTYAPDVITGTIVFDTFRSSDFNTGGFTPLHRDEMDPGLTLTVGGAPDIDLIFDLGDVGGATTMNLNTGLVLDDANTQLSLGGTVLTNLGGGFSFTGGNLASNGVYVPLTSVQLTQLFASPPGVTPIGVPLGLPSPSGPTLTGIRFVSTPPVGGGSSSPLPLPVAGNGSPAGIVFSSSADVERIRNEGRENENADQPTGCPGESNFEWLEQGARSAARELDWGRRSGVGTDPEDTENVFKPASCYFAG